MKRILVFGWYHNHNIGDDLFMEAFERLFPECQFTFITATISADQLRDADAIFFGGGSFLLGRPDVFPEALTLLKTKKIFYLGVGAETDIHPFHQELMSDARLIATRSIDQVERLKTINSNVRFLPDLVYSLQDKVHNSAKIVGSVLIMPNIVVVPQSNSPHWKHASWNYFKSEFVQFLDWLVETGYHPHFFSMCRGEAADDGWVAAELIGQMERRHHKYLLPILPVGITATTALVSRYETVITQRFHGIVLAEMTRTPYLAIHHHDKLKLCQPNEGKFLSYYNLSKDSLIESFNKAHKMNYRDVLPLSMNIFRALADEVTNLL